MTKAAARALRERRKNAGVVQLNVWVAEEDREHALKALAPFIQKAMEKLPQKWSRREEELVAFSFKFRVNPPASFRDKLKKIKFDYDRDTQIWRTECNALEAKNIEEIVSEMDELFGVLRQF